MATRSFDTMTIAQLQDYLQGEGVELPKKGQLKKYYVELAKQQSTISSSGLTSPRTRWGSEPIELRTSPLGKQTERTEETSAYQGAQNPGLPKQEEVTVAREETSKQRVSERLKSPERGRLSRQESQGTPSKPRRMREMSPLRQAKSPSRRREAAPRGEGAISGASTTSKFPKDLNDALYGSGGASTSKAPKDLNDVLYGTIERTPPPVPIPSFQQPIAPVRPEYVDARKEEARPLRPKREQPETRRKRASVLQVLTRKTWGAAKAGGRLLGRLLSYRPPPSLFILLLVGVVSALAVSYLREALRPVPFCDTGASPAGTECIPCPEHGYCETGQLQCAVGYERVGRHCVKDKRVEARVQKLAGKTRRFVCHQRGLSLCGFSAPGAVTRDSVMALLGEGQEVDQRTADIFTLAVQRSGEELLMAVEDGILVLVCPDDLAQQYKPLGCRAREELLRRWKPLALFLLSGLGVLYYLWRRRQQQALSRAAETLFEQICTELEDAAQRPGGAPSWKIATHFRDALLRPRERGGPLWREVERLAVEDTRVLVRQQMVQGESFTVWEWREAGALLSPTFKNRTAATATPGTPTAEPSDPLLRRRSSQETPSRNNGTPSRVYPSTKTINMKPVQWKL